jgi:hypothetical protein
MTGLDLTVKTISSRFRDQTRLCNFRTRPDEYLIQEMPGKSVDLIRSAARVVH